MLKTLSYLATIALVSFCSLFEGALTPEEGPEPESPSLNLTISIAADYRGPDFLFTIVEVTNDSESSVSAEVGIKATGGSSTKPNTGSAGIQEIPAGQTVKYEVTTAGLAKNTDYSIQAFATVDGKTYTSEAKSSGTEPLRFYLSPETTEYSWLIGNSPWEIC